MRKYTLLFLLFFSHYLFSQSKYVPADLNDGWKIGSATENINLSALSDSLEKVYEKIDGIVVIKDGRLIFEKYYNGYSPFILHDTRSATKSITSLLIGKAIDLNYLKSEDELIAPYFSDYKLNATSIRLKDILMMRSGLDCDDWNMNSKGNEQNMSHTSNWYKYIIELEKVAEPGEKFSYCTGSYNLLGKVLEKRANTSIVSFSRKQLFAPLKIEDYNWYINTHNFKPYMGGGLFLNLRDFAKFGQVMLDEGKWQGKQVISNQWISKIWNNGRAIEPEGDSLMYSYGWWLKKIKYNGKIYNLATASGNGGQKIMVVKELSLVFAMFGNGYNEPFFEEEQPVKILKNHLLTVQGNEETNPDHMTEKEMKALGYKVIDYIVDHRLNFDAEKVSNIGSYASLSKQVKEEIPINGESPQAVFEELNAFIKDNIVHLDHPRLFSFIPGPSNYYSILADTLATGYNVFAGHWLGGSAAAMIESRTTEWLKHIAGYPKGSGGLFVSGGSMANLTAIVAARTNKLQDDYAKGTIYYSEQTHSSLSKALRAIGFQKQHMRKISTQDNFQIDISALRKALKEDVAVGYVPCCIIGNAGTTNTGAIDGPNELAAIARQYNAWFHIDAAYGGATLLSEPYKEQVSGIEKADSITLDPHKWWFQPYEMGCLLVKDKKTLKASFAVHAEYLDDTIKDEKEINYYDYGVQLSRSFRALKLYTFFRCKGLTKIGDYVTQGIKNAEYLEELFNDKAYWEVLSKPSIGIISFRAKIDALDNDALNAEISQHVSESGYAMITTTKLKGHLALRMCPIHPETTKEHLSKTVALMNVFIENKIT